MKHNFKVGEQTATYIEAMHLLNNAENKVMEALCCEYEESQAESIAKEFTAAMDKAKDELAKLLYLGINLKICDYTNLNSRESII